MLPHEFLHWEDMVHQTRFGLCTDMRLHVKEILVTFLRLMHLGITFAFLLLGRLGAWMMVAPTMVRWRNDRTLSRR